MPNRPKTKARGLRVPEDLWEAIEAQAGQRGETATDVMLRALRREVSESSAIESVTLEPYTWHVSRGGRYVGIVAQQELREGPTYTAYGRGGAEPVRDAEFPSRDEAVRWLLDGCPTGKESITKGVDMQDSTEAPFVWRGKTIVTVGDISDAMLAVKTPAEAAEFLAAYRATNEHAEANIGYISGYYDTETGDRVRRWFGVRHPIFG